MPFPLSERVIYRSNPLTQVVCQLRFPTILRIESEIPAQFQDAVRNRFPIFNQVAPVGPNEVPPELIRMLPPGINIVAPKMYAFGSEDQIWKLTLGKESISLSCGTYRRWEDFRELFAPALEALHRIYRPAFFTRVGLRYRNVIQRSRIGLAAENWAALLQPYIAPEFAAPIADELHDTKHILTVRIDDTGGKVRISHGLEKIDNEQVYSIDNDFYTTNRIEVANALERLDHFNRQSGHLFRWCITERLHNALEPNVVAGQQAP